MFTGIIEEMGRISRVLETENSYGLEIEAGQSLEDASIGDSIAVDGVCLTMTELRGDRFTVGLAPETLSRTTLGSFEAGSRVNLERSLTPRSRMGGHFVQGHIDGTGTITSRIPDADSVRLEIAFDPDLMKYVVNKGFVAIDGISLTVIDAFEDRFTLMLIAHTLEHVTLGAKSVGDKVNIEVDILAKYVEKVAGVHVRPPRQQELSSIQ
jgi:riboflavin synthase